LARPAENLLRSGGRSIRVHGSGSLDPAKRRLRDPDPRTDVARQTVILSWVVMAENRRWLTNEEISGGVIAALAAPDHETIIVGDANGQQM